MAVHFDESWLEEFVGLFGQECLVSILIGGHVHFVNRTFLAWGGDLLLSGKWVMDVLLLFL